MTKIKVDYVGGLRTQSEHLDSKHIIVTDAPKDNNGLGRKFSPTDLVASSLGSCLLTIMGIVADRHDIKLKGTYADVEKKMSEKPRRISHILVNIYFSKLIVENDKKILIQAAKHCPVHNSLHPDINITINFK